MKLVIENSFIMFRGAVLVLFFMAQLSCSYMPTSTDTIPENWAQTVEKRQQLAAWKLKGRFGIQTENNGGSLDLFWNQNKDVYKIRLIAAMGQGTVLIKGDALGVSLRTSEGEVYADNADELLSSYFGVVVPLTGLHDWLRGVPSADGSIQKQLWDEQGQLHKLVQDGWNIEMSAYKKVGQYILPHTFYLSRDDQSELEIRLIIQQWTLPSRDVS